jgi:hypothetical protein
VDGAAKRFEAGRNIWDEAKRRAVNEPNEMIFGSSAATAEARENLPSK